MPKLDYAASVPMNVRAPFSVSVDAAKEPPGDRTFRDFIPREQNAPIRADDSIRRKNFSKPIAARYEDDFVSRGEADRRQQGERAEILAIAKELYAADEKRRKAFEAAEKMATQSPNDSNAAELEKARKILSGPKPLTKETAIEKATKQYFADRK